MSGLFLRVLPSLRHRLRLNCIQTSVWNVRKLHFGAPVLRSSTIPAGVGLPPVIRHGIPLAPAVDRLVTHVADNCIGDSDVFSGPFGERKLTYIDYTASGRALKHIEDYISNEVLPMYGNSHSTVSQCAYQSTMFREEARALIKDRMRATDKDAVIFCGSGATAGFDKLVHILGLRKAGVLSLATDATKTAKYVCAFPGCSRRFRDAGDLKLHQRTHRDGDFHSVGTHVSTAAPGSTEHETTPAVDLADTPLVIVGPYAHHSNLLPWFESIADITFVPEAVGVGGVDLVALESVLAANKHRSTVVGAFTAASNVTGATVDVDAITRLIHVHGGVVVWDYAAAAPHLPIDMNPPHPNATERALLAKDAVVLSPHKFAGGPGCTGLLLVKRALFKSTEPSTAGGGTVFFVHPDGTPRYLADDAEREEGGTPNVIGCIRTGLVMQLQYAVGYDVIDGLESAMANEARRVWSAHPSIAIAGNTTGRRVGIISFQIVHGDRLLHWQYVSQLLNDLFGIQCRGGCLCAGPYAMSLLGITEDQAQALESQLLEKDEMLRPGFVRVSFPYHMSRSAFEFVLSAVLWVADNGHALLPLYSPFADTGEWKHKSIGAHPRPRRWLNSIKYDSGECVYPSTKKTTPMTSVEAETAVYASYFEAANAALAGVSAEREKLGRKALGASGLLSVGGEPLRWFAVAGENAAPSSSSRLPLAQSLVKLGGHPEASLPAAADAAPHLADTVKTSEATCAPIVSDTASSRAVRLKVPSESGGFEKVRIVSSAPEEACNPTGMEEFTKSLERKILETDVKPIKPPKHLLSLIGRAIGDFQMIKDGDKLMLGLSGGKDSMSLLHCLLDIQRRAPIKFTLAACTVDPQAPGFRPEPLKQYLAKLGVPYFFESQPIIELASKQPQKVTSICAWCSRMKRGILYSTARREGYNVLVLGQHLDDMAESFVMSAFYNGLLRTMKANYTINAGDLRVIRPLAYARERVTRQFASDADLPIIEENCPACYDAPTVRYRVKTLLAAQEHVNPPLFGNICRALKPLMTRNHAGEADGTDLDDDE